MINGLKEILFISLKYFYLIGCKHHDLFFISFPVGVILRININTSDGFKLNEVVDFMQEKQVCLIR
jgi:hypothetical protein